MAVPALASRLMRAFYSPRAGMATWPVRTHAIMMTAMSSDAATPLPYRMGRAMIDGFYLGLAAAGRYQPLAHPRVHNLDVIKDVPYGDHRVAHRLDIYRPRRAKG